MNSRTAVGQVEGGVVQAVGFAHSEETYYDDKGRLLNADFGSYLAPMSSEVPPLDVIFVQTDEPSGPFGAKSISEISIDGVAPALVNAIHNATDKWIRTLPLTPERVWRAIHDK